MCLILLKDEQAGEIVVANTVDFFRQKDSFRLYLAVWGLLGLKMCLNISLHFAPTTPTRTQRGTTHARLVFFGLLRNDSPVETPCLFYLPV